jgi:hypothetical protein
MFMSIDVPIKSETSAIGNSETSTGKKENPEVNEAWIEIRPNISDGTRDGGCKLEMESSLDF